MYKLEEEDISKIRSNAVEDKLRIEELLKQGIIHGVRDLSEYTKEIARDTRILTLLDSTVKEVTING